MQVLDTCVRGVCLEGEELTCRLRINLTMNLSQENVCFHINGKWVGKRREV